MKRTADRNDEPAALPRKISFKKRKKCFTILILSHVELVIELFEDLSGI